MAKKIADFDPAVPNAPMTDHAQRHNAEADAIDDNAEQIKNLWTVNTDRKNETEANALAITTKFSMGSTWGKLAGRS